MASDKLEAHVTIDGEPLIASKLTPEQFIFEAVKPAIEACLVTRKEQYPIEHIAKITVHIRMEPGKDG